MYDGKSESWSKAPGFSYAVVDTKVDHNGTRYCTFSETPNVSR